MFPSWALVTHQSDSRQAVAQTCLHRPVVSVLGYSGGAENIFEPREPVGRQPFRENAVEFIDAACSGLPVGNRALQTFRFAGFPPTRGHPHCA